MIISILGRKKIFCGCQFHIKEGFFYNPNIDPLILFHYKRKSRDWYDVDYWSNILDIDIIEEKKKQGNMSLIKLKKNAIETLEKLKNLDKRIFSCQCS